MTDESGTVARLQHLLELGRPREALRLVGPALVAQPGSARLLALAAHAHLLLDQPEEAVDLATRAAAGDPDDEWPHRLRSIGLAALDRVEEAAASAYESVRLEPSLYLTHLQYARALARFDTPQARAQAWQEGRRAAELAPNEPAVHVLMAALAHPSEGTPPQALWVARDALERALALDPGHAGALNDLARVQLSLGSRADAFEGFSAALTADPQSRVALGNVVVALSGYVVPAYWTVAAAAYLSLGASAAEAGGTGRALQAVLATALVGAVALLGLRLRRRVRSRLGLFLREAARRNRPGAVTAATLAIAAALVVAGPLLPDLARPAVAGTACGLVVALTGGLVVLATVQRVRHGRSPRR